MISAVVSALAIALLAATGLYLWHAAYRTLLFHVATAIVLPPFLCAALYRGNNGHTGAAFAGGGWGTGPQEALVASTAIIMSATVLTAIGWMVFGCHPWLLYRAGRRVRWLSPHTPETAMLLSLGLHTALSGMVVLWFSSRYQVLGFRILTTTHETGLMGIRASDIVELALAAALFTVVVLLYNRTDLGLRIRMIADRPALAGAMGERGIAAGFATVFAGALLFGVAGIISALEHGFTVASGFRHLLVGAAALVISGPPPGGGLWPRLPLACLAATVLTAAAAWYLGPIWADALAFSILAGALAVHSGPGRGAGLKARR